MSTSTTVGVQQPEEVSADVKRYVIDVGYAKVLIEEHSDGRLLVNGSLVELYDLRSRAKYLPSISKRP